ncbi:16967_t:CDS:2, partial [Dentiscutata heterogama]
ACAKGCRSFDNSSNEFHSSADKRSFHNEEEEDYLKDYMLNSNMFEYHFKEN